MERESSDMSSIILSQSDGANILSNLETSYSQKSQMGGQPSQQRSQNPINLTIDNPEYLTESITRYDQQVQDLAQSKSKKQLRQLLFEKYANVLIHLSKAKPTYLASYIVDQKQPIQNRGDSDKSYFTFKMDKGNPSFIKGNNSSLQGNLKYDSDFVKYLWREESRDGDDAYCWLSSTINGVLELQANYIFHSDLIFRNTIKVNNPQPSPIAGRRSWIYKIIDFDGALELSGEQSKYNYFSTLDLINYWLNQSEPFDERIYRRILFKDELVNLVDNKLKSLGINSQLDQQRNQIRQKVKAIKRQNDEDRNFIVNCMDILQLLKAYSRFYHKVQILHLLNLTLTDHIGSSEMKELLNCAICIRAVNQEENKEGLNALLMCLGRVMKQLPGSQVITWSQ